MEAYLAWGVQPLYLPPWQHLELPWKLLASQVLLHKVKQKLREQKLREHSAQPASQVQRHLGHCFAWVAPQLDLPTIQEPRQAEQQLRQRWAKQVYQVEWGQARYLARCLSRYLTWALQLFCQPVLQVLEAHQKEQVHQRRSKARQEQALCSE